MGGPRKSQGVGGVETQNSSNFSHLVSQINFSNENFVGIRQKNVRSDSPSRGGGAAAAPDAPSESANGVQTRGGSTSISWVIHFQ